MRHSKGEIDMAYNVERVMQKYAKEIDFIMTATKVGPADVRERERVTSALKYSLAVARNEAGQNPSAEDTDLYKLAEAIRLANNQEECVAAIKRAFPCSWSIILETYDLDWKIPECKTMLRAGRTRHHPSSRIGSEVETLEQDVKALDRHLEELAEEVRKREVDR